MKKESDQNKETQEKERRHASVFGWIKYIFRRTRPLKEGEIVFSYPEGYLEDAQDKIFYSDSFFLSDNSTFNKPLAIASMGLTMTSFSSNKIKQDIKLQSQNVKSFLSSCGFEDIYTNPYFDEESKPDGIAYAFGMKTIITKEAKFTLIAIGIRGANYGKEWSSNFQIGDSQLHEGFVSASLQILSDFEKYIAKRKIKGNIRLWMSGFSRGAGVCNILSQDLEKSLLSLPKKAKIEKVYSYCFATPKVSKLNDSSSKGIFNIINPYDLIPRIPCWNYYRFGRDVYLPFKENPDPSFHKTNTKIIRKNKDEMSVDQKYEFANEIEDFVKNKLPIETYLEFYQGLLVNIMKLVDVKKDNPYADISSFVSSIVKEISEEFGKVKFVAKLIFNNSDWEKAIKPSVEKALKGRSYEIEESSILKVIDRLLSFIKKDFLSSRDFYLTLGHEGNLASYLEEHKHSLYMSMLRGL